jgi:hypothetical protein
MIIRREKNKNYSVIANECFKDSTISARAKGIYAYVMTLPDDWKLSKKELYNHFSEGQRAIDTAFNELVKKGYVEKITLKKSNGHFQGSEYIFYEFSTNNTTPNNSSKTYKTETAIPADSAGNGDSVNGRLRNSPLLKTNKENTKKETKKTNKKEITINHNLDKSPEHLVSSSFSFFDEKEDDAQDNLNSLKSELFKIGLSEVQVSSVLIKYPINFIDEAVFNTMNANSLRVIDKLPAQYFYGILKNIESQQGLER